jgi:hypothetical protein
MTPTEQGDSMMVMARAMTERQCGGCTLCCKLLPVRSLGKGAGQRCQHQRSGKGCAVYSKLLSVAPECRFWNCRWVVGEAGATGRPDRTHYVIDVMPDYIGAQDDETGEVMEVPVVQIWIDPGFPDAHRDPELRAWLDSTKQVALIRYSASDAFVLFPPSRMKSREWTERHSDNRGPTHTAADIFRVLGENA